MPTQMFELGTTRFEPYRAKMTNGVMRRDWRVYTMCSQRGWARVGTLHGMTLTATRAQLMEAWRQLSTRQGKSLAAHVASAPQRRKVGKKAPRSWWVDECQR